MTLFYSVCLLILFYLLLIIEFMLPTGGMLGAAALASLVASVIIAFSHSFTAGMTVLLIVTATTPLVFLAMVRLWPHTPIGRRMLNRRPGQPSEPAPKRTTAHGTPLEELVGQVGIAKSHLLPSGLVAIGSQKLDAVSTGMPIDTGSPVVVVRIASGKIHVRPATEEEIDRQDGTPKSPPSLEQPLESFEIE